MNKNNLKVSVIIPVYNSEKTVKKAIESVLLQSYKNIEVILIDDGSTDSSADICREISHSDQRVKLYRQLNSGVSAARNYGIRNATGDYVMFLDSDDRFTQDCIERCIESSKNGTIDIVKFSYKKVLGPIRMCYHYSCNTEVAINKSKFPTDVYPLIFSTYDFSNVWSAMISRKIAKNTEFRGYIAGEDFLYFCECLKKSQSLFIIRDPLYLYYIGVDSATHQHTDKILARRISDNNEVLKKIYEMLKEPSLLESYRNRLESATEKVKPPLYKLIMLKILGGR